MSWKLKALDDQKVPDSAKVKQAVRITFLLLKFKFSKKMIRICQKECSQSDFLLNLSLLSPKVRIMSMKAEVKEVADNAGAGAA